MLKDPFLRAHRYLSSNRFISLAGDITPISVRDQSLRGYLAVRRCIDGELIEKSKQDPSPLVIVGAGVAGATAAIVASKHGIPVILYERYSAAFKTMADVRTRSLDYRQYEWPRAGWRRMHDDEGANLPFTFTQHKASTIVGSWEGVLKKEISDSKTISGRGIIDFQTDSEIYLDEEQLSSGSDHDSVSYCVGENGTPHEAQIILWCVGFGVEKNTITVNKDTVYTSSKYWSNDKYDLIYKNQGKSAKVLITGGGDGSLQDFLRIATGSETAKDLYQRLNINGFIEPALRAELLSIEMDAQRAFRWSADEKKVRKYHDAPILQYLMKRYVEWCRAILNDQIPGSKSLREVLRTILAPSPRVFIASHKPYFDFCYPLNRFLATLICEYVAHYSDGVWNDAKIANPFIACAEIVGVNPKDPPPDYNPANLGSCEEYWHQVDFEDTIGKWPLATRDYPLPTREHSIFKPIIVRHGIKTEKLKCFRHASKTDMIQARKRHLLPGVAFESMVIS